MLQSDESSADIGSSYPPTLVVIPVSYSQLGVDQEDITLFANEATIAKYVEIIVLNLSLVLT